MPPLSRDIPVDKTCTTVLYIDCQNFNCHRNGGEYKSMSSEEQERRFKWFFDKIDSETIPNLVDLQKASRNNGLEVMYTVIESLTKDGRDRSLDYKITGFNVPRGSWDGKVIDALKPLDDEIVLPKTSSSVFISTHIDYVLRNLGTRYLVICGFLTDQCVESTARDACDLGYYVTVITDSCATLTQERHERSLSAVKGYCRQITTREFIEELNAQSDTNK